jgi:phenylacetyl-CoA:acceptor oxidoreductase subunit 1
MVIDLRKCIGCGACTIACKQTNKVPINSWRRVFDCGTSDAPERMRTFVPISCMHCGKAPCVEVCPTGASYRRSDGIVDIKNERCVGCGYCIIACPYQARIIIFHNEHELKVKKIFYGLGDADINLDRIGVSTKCNFCRQKITEGMRRGLTPGLDRDASPECVISCSAKAMRFGDLDNPDSVVSRLLRERKTARLQERLGTEPSIYYILN